MGSWSILNPSANFELVPVTEALNLFSGPSIVGLDVRPVICHGVLPMCHTAMRRKKGESVDEAMERLFEAYMMQSPPDDLSRALIITSGDPADDTNDTATELAIIVEWLRRRASVKTFYRLRGGADELFREHRFLFSLPRSLRRVLPRQLSPTLLLGTTATATEAAVVKGLCAQLVVTLSARPLHLEHVPAGRHLVFLEGGAARAAGTRGLLLAALPALLSASGAGSRVLVHVDGAGATDGSAAALVCAALVADSTGEMGVDAAAERLARCAPGVAALPADVLAELHELEEWLLDGAPQKEASTGGDDVDEGPTAQEVAEAVAAAAATAARSAAEAGARAAKEEAEEEEAMDAMLRDIETSLKAGGGAQRPDVRGQSDSDHVDQQMAPADSGESDTDEDTDVSGEYAG